MIKYFESIFWGIIAALGALFLEFVLFTAQQTILYPNLRKEASIELLTPTILAIAGFSFFEEFTKLLIIAKRIKVIFSPKSTLWGPLLLGFGFSLTEIFFVIPQKEISLVNIFDFFLIHITTALITGYFFLCPTRNIVVAGLKALIFSWTIHFGYNLAVIKISENSEWLINSYLLVLFVIDLSLWIVFQRKLAPKKNMLYNKIAKA